MLRLAQIVRRFKDAYLKRRHGRVPTHQRKALKAIESCRTSRLGGILRACTHCGHAHVRWHSCRNRHCPRCQQGKQQEWITARLRELPPVAYTHLVFTVPGALAEHCRAQPEILYRALFEAASKSILQLARERYGIKPGMIAVLHTWGQTLHFHPHIHLIVTAGGMTPQGQWKTTGKNYFLPVVGLSRIYRAKCFGALKRLGQSLPAKPLPPKWVVHGRPPQASPGSILLYLARYVYRVAIDESRLQSIDAEGVTFSYKDYRDESKVKTMTLDGEEFLRRFLNHILPTGFVKVRHYGIFAHAIKAAALKELRTHLCQQFQDQVYRAKAILALLAHTTPEPPVPQCTRCGSVQLIATEIMPIDSPGKRILKPP